MNIKNSATALTGSACLNSVELEFRDAMQSFFGPLDWLPVGDGEIHRFHVAGDKPRTRNGWYVLYTDCIAGGAYGSWNRGKKNTWRIRKPANLKEATLQLERSRRIQRLQEAERQRSHQVAATKAERLWEASVPANPNHTYLITKRCDAYCLREQYGALLVPLYRDGELLNLQRIYPNGIKRFMPKGRIKGCYSPIGSPERDRPIYICEGWATGATLYEETGTAVACAMNAGNLLAVGRQLQQEYPDSPLIIAGDDDRKTEGNPGRTAANKAAAALGCSLVFPPFPDDAPLELSDFNDLANWRAAQ
tara:strand:+ start:2830 stop:3747 length:918 start_codon:yes stop_codon:yes gene_type:complete